MARCSRVTDVSSLTNSSSAITFSVTSATNTNIRNRFIFSCPSFWRGAFRGRPGSSPACNAPCKSVTPCGKRRQNVCGYFYGFGWSYHSSFFRSLRGRRRVVGRLGRTPAGQGPQPGLARARRTFTPDRTLIGRRRLRAPVRRHIPPPPSEYSSAW